MNKSWTGHILDYMCLSTHAWVCVHVNIYVYGWTWVCKYMRMCNNQLHKCQNYPYWNYFNWKYNPSELEEYLHIFISTDKTSSIGKIRSVNYS